MNITADVSIHAPRAGGDVMACPVFHAAAFQSTPPARGATRKIIFLQCHNIVSIHAPRAGGDAIDCCRIRGICVSIHAPRAGGDLL